MIAPEKQGWGIAAAALTLGKLLLPNAHLRAVILPGNVASIRLFERAGYDRVDEPVWVLTPKNADGKTGLTG